MPIAPITERWIPVPIQRALTLGNRTDGNTVLLWLSMMNDAKKNENGHTQRALSEIEKEIHLSPKTIRKCTKNLIAAKLIEPVVDRKKPSREKKFAVTPLAAFQKTNPPPPEKKSKPIGDWEL